MTLRIPPVGSTVIALVGLVTIGCTAQTATVFDTLIDPARAATTSTTDGAASGTWIAQRDGYVMSMPAGWSGAWLLTTDGEALVDALVDTHPALAARIELVLGETGAQPSFIGFDATGDALVPPAIIVLAQPTEGRKAHWVKKRAEEQIGALPGLRGSVIRDDVRLANADGTRFDYVIDDEDLGTLRVRTFLFRFGGQAYLVTFAAAAADFEEAEIVFDRVADSVFLGV